MHGRPGEKKDQLAADQGARRVRARRQGPGHPGRDAAVGGQRPLDPGDRAKARARSASGIRTGASRKTSRPAPRRTVAAAPARAKERSPRRAAAAKKTQEQEQERQKSGGGAPLPDFVPPSLATLRDAARRAARAGCTRSSSTAIASRRGSITARCGCSPARVSTGRRNFPTSPRRWQRCPPRPP